MKKFMRRLGRKFFGRCYLIPGYIMAAKMAIVGGSVAGAQAFGVFALSMMVVGLVFEAAAESLYPLRDPRRVR